MTRLSHEDWILINAMMLEIHRSTSEEELLKSTLKWITASTVEDFQLQEMAGSTTEPPEEEFLPVGPWVLSLARPPCDRLRAWFEIMSSHVSLAWRRIRAGGVEPDTNILSRRQREVMPLLLKGASNSEIAHSLGISPRTVEKHITAILRQNRCVSRTQLLAARAAGIACWLLFMLLEGTSAAQGQPGRKAALVIGNNDYQHATPLVSCVREAAAMTEVLRQAGFEVAEPVFNGTRQDMLDAADAFLERARGAEVGLLYFAGHGMLLADQQTRDRSYNYMLPVDARLLSDRDEEIKSRTISVQYLLKGMEDVGAACKIVILDACQNNGLAQGRAAGNVRGGAGAQADLPTESFVALATIPGTSAVDGDERQMSPFTTAFIENIKAYPDATLTELFAGVNGDVTRRLGQEQVPVVQSTLSRKYIRFSFFPSGQAPSLTGADPMVEAHKVNSLGMKFLPLPGGAETWICQWETRQRDYQAFLKQQGQASQNSTLLTQGDDTCPAVNLSLEDAIAFCDWLTRHEQNLPAGQGARLSSRQHYRLPTQMEWSALAQKRLEESAAPSSFNLADAALGRVRPDWPHDRGVNDGTAYLAAADATPGGPPKHLIGNVWEWLADGGRPGLGIVAGGAWNHAGKLSVDELILSKPRNLRSPDIGFRLVLATLTPHEPTATRQ